MVWVPVEKADIDCILMATVFGEGACFPFSPVPRGVKKRKRKDNNIQKTTPTRSNKIACLKMWRGQTSHRASGTGTAGWWLYSCIVETADSSFTLNPRHWNHNSYLAGTHLYSIGHRVTTTTIFFSSAYKIKQLTENSCRTIVIRFQQCCWCFGFRGTAWKSLKANMQTSNIRHRATEGSLVGVFLLERDTLW